MNPTLNTNSRALFLGPDAENMDHMKDLMNYILDNLAQWRKDANKGYPSTIDETQNNDEFKATQQRNADVIKKICEMLDDSTPFTKATYFGHMNTDTLMASNLAQFAALMRNQNNVAYESSPATTRMEFAAGDQLLKFFGFDPEEGMIHITSCGSIANIESYWKLRNVKSLALALGQHEATKELMGNRSEYELLTMPLPEVYAVMDKAKEMGVFEEVRELTVRNKGMVRNVGHVVLPASKHYSHLKACDVLGLGHELVHEVPVHKDYAVDMEQYRKIIIDLVEKKIPIMAAVAVIGSTENGAFDDIKEFVAIRDYVEKTYGVSYPLMIDSAYGGYVRAMIIDGEGKEMSYEDCKAHWDAQLPGFFTRHFYDCLYHMRSADVIVVDPHKLGYVPYGAGAVVFRDVRILDASTYSAPYVFNEQESALFRRIVGSCTLEGSRAGATSAAVYGAHLACPLNIHGYGQLMMDTLIVSRLLEAFLDNIEFEVNGRKFKTFTSPDPDFHMINWSVKEVNDDSLEAHNKMNEFLYEKCSVLGAKFQDEDFIVSSTSFTEEEYREAPWAYAKKMGYSRAEWDKVQSIYSLRSTCMGPFLKNKETFDRFAPIMRDYFVKVITEYVNKQ